MQYGFVIDQRKCIGCHGCSVACKSENSVALGVHRTWVKYVEKGRFPFTRRFFQVTRCNHCSHPPCVTICPVSAMFQRKDGVVDFDSTRCIGCKACMQACPYDAIYLDPATDTAAKCNYCIHRVERGLEPACVVMCPQHAIIAGDLEQPDSEIARLVSREQVRVRKPEQGTAPKTFYVAAEEAAISPTAARYEGMYMWADRNKRIAGGGAIRVAPNGDLPAPVLAAYDVEHERPWNWQVPVYFWTKSLSTGVLALPAVAIAAGWVQADKLLNLVLVILALVFLGITVGLLISDLSRRERFLQVLLRPQGSSWLTRGAYLLVAYTALCGLYALAELTGIAPLCSVMRWLAVAGGALAAVYTAFLFGQCEGRDLWQTPLLPLHLLVQGWLASAAVLALLAPLFGDTQSAIRVAAAALTGGLALHILTLATELLMPHATETATYAARLITRGPFRFIFWGGAVVLGVLLPVVLLAVGWGHAGLVGTAGVLVLAGLLAYEWCFVMAAQGVPNS
jgi:Fe-S-cluster-containing dehydrogenase component/formate-dependent nitrite reductase membrane component NrfD